MNGSTILELPTDVVTDSDGVPALVHPLPESIRVELAPLVRTVREAVELG
jgi:hypothetical protein